MQAVKCATSDGMELAMVNFDLVSLKSAALNHSTKLTWYGSVKSKYSTDCPDYSRADFSCGNKV